MRTSPAGFHESRTVEVPTSIEDKPLGTVGPFGTWSVIVVGADCGETLRTLSYAATAYV